MAASRALALFAAAGGLWLLAAGAAVPGVAGHGATLAVSLVLGVVLVAAGAGAWIGAERTPTWVLAIVAPFSVLLIGALNLITHDSSTGSQLFLLWPVLFAASFLSRRLTAVVLLEVLVVEAILMGALQPPSRAVADTLALAVAFTMAASAVLTFRVRIDALLAALSAQAREDALTGLPNRRAFDEALARLAGLSQRSGEALSLVCVDVDRFKEVNDTRGHTTGDRVLRAVADALRGSGRDVDVVARVGGDEFAVLLAGCSFEDATLIGVTIQERVTAHTVRLGHAVTVSVGTATMPSMAVTPEDLLVAADAALYAAKQDGRDGAAPPLVRPG